MYIRDDDLRRIARLWHELAEIPAARGDEALTHCFAQLAQIVGAGNVFMVGAVREIPRPTRSTGCAAGAPTPSGASTATKPASVPSPTYCGTSRPTPSIR